MGMMLDWLTAGAQIPDDPELEVDLICPQAKRKLRSDARASPPLLSGTILSSSTVTSEISTAYSSSRALFQVG
jgi:hypothetical protein